MHSKLALRGPRNGVTICSQSSRGVRPALLFTQVPNLPTKRAGGRAGCASRGDSGEGGAPQGRLVYVITPVVASMP
eukprot:4313401-Alexandrium_andersonii.AAC.1